MTIQRLKCDLSPELTTCLKLKDAVRPDCCRVADPIPYDGECFVRDIGKELEKLSRRHERMFVKRRRLMEMAVPNRRTCRFVPKCACLFSKTIEMVRPCDAQSHTRTEQLALPPVRRLLQRRRAAVHNGDKIGESILNRWLRYSYMSLYSRLANIQPLTKPKKKKKKSEKVLAKHDQYIQKLANPKKVPSPPKPERKTGTSDRARLKKLSTPRAFHEEVKRNWELTPEMKNYKASKRLNEISQPVQRENVHINESPEKVSPNALKYKPSARIKEMSEPLTTRDANQGLADVKENPFGIAPNALKYKPTNRIKELAEPKEFENTHIRENPFAISPAALKAKASPRLIELAKPKGG
ncbi:sperm microtubule associated protein 2-like [Drosophila bipectinata]|uniref:sperm microtubule associated protein 2-like n=1 Tax=Drosophila bipectinata TaxID=42026 RepID=UPI0007E8A1C8|nr:uncharacterized protein LOC108129287 [Drosophila bipectinata]KAH8236498.1 hypothetical protein KR026_003805 [Drosophila bipectinata]